MFIVLNWRAVSYSILIGQNKYICQNVDQITALLESGQKLAQSRRSLMNKKRSVAN